MALEIRVLVVEDDPETRMLTEALLSGRKGVCLCALAKDGLEGLELVEQVEHYLNEGTVRNLEALLEWLEHGEG